MTQIATDVGGRFLFERMDATERTAAYRLTVTGEGEMWRAVAEVELPGGEFELRWEVTRPPEWMTQTAQAFLKTQLTAYRRADRTSTPPDRLWPRRIHRWRAPRPGAN